MGRSTENDSYPEERVDGGLTSKSNRPQRTWSYNQDAGVSPFIYQGEGHVAVWISTHSESASCP